MPDNTNSTNLVSGNYVQLLISICVAIGTFSFVSPKVFTFLDSFCKTAELQTSMFALFFVSYPLLPVLGFLLIYSITADIKIRNIIIFQHKKANLNTSKLLLLITTSVLFVNIIGMIYGFVSIKAAPFSDYTEYKEERNKCNNVDTFFQLTNNAITHKNAEQKMNVIFPYDSTNAKDSVKTCSYADNIFLELAAHSLISTKKSPFEKGNYDTCCVIKNMDLVSSTALDSFKTALGFQDTIMQLNKLRLETLYAKTTRKEFETLFKLYRNFLVFGIALLSIICVYILIQLSRRAESCSRVNTLMKSLSGCYLLMLLQLVQPIKAEHIPLDNNGFEYKFHNWYLPTSISNETSEWNQYDNRIYKNYYGNNIKLDASEPETPTWNPEIIESELKPLNKTLKDSIKLKLTNVIKTKDGNITIKLEPASSTKDTIIVTPGTVKVDLGAVTDAIGNTNKEINSLTNILKNRFQTMQNERRSSEEEQIEESLDNGN